MDRQGIFKKCLYIKCKNYCIWLLYLQNRALAVCGCVASPGSPGPALLTARTRNWYTLPSFRSGTRALHSGVWGEKGYICLSTIKIYGLQRSKGRIINSEIGCLFDSL